MINGCKVIGMDEVGRGALAGPVVVGAFSFSCSAGEVVAWISDLLESTGLKSLKDSKRLTQRAREKVFEHVKHESFWSVGEASCSEIDELGLTKALVLASGRALDSLMPQIGDNNLYIISDAGLHHPYEEKLPTEVHIKGDEKYWEIMLASIMAKVYRDELMRNQDQVFPGYNFAQHVGYGTRSHYKAIDLLGVSPIHRKLFFKRKY